MEILKQWAYVMQYPIILVNKELESADNKAEGRYVLVSMWPQAEGRGLREVVRNIISIVNAEEAEIHTHNNAEVATDYALELKYWNRGLAALEVALNVLDRENRGIKIISKSANPLSKHGFTNHPIYSAMWNPNPDGMQSQNKQASQYQKLRWWWLRVQASQIKKYNISITDYILAHIDVDDNHKFGKWLDVDNLVVKECKINFASVGLALRKISESEHEQIISSLVECCDQDLLAGAKKFLDLNAAAENLRSNDAYVQNERQSIISAFTLTAAKYLGAKAISRTNDSEKQYGSRKRKTYMGFTESLQQETPPEQLDDLTNWMGYIDVIDVGSKGTSIHETDEEIDFLKDSIEKGLESPRVTGLQLFNPKALMGHMARAKHQSHHLAMMRQGFSWDQNVLSPVERFKIIEMIEDVCHTEPTISITQKSSNHLIGTEAVHFHPWWTKAVVTVAWLCGRSLAEVLELQWLSTDELSKASDNLFGVGQIGDLYFWRLPVRIATPICKQEFTYAVPRIDHVLVEDHSGLAKALINAHLSNSAEKNKVDSSKFERSRIFTWRKEANKRKDEVHKLLATITGTLYARDLKLSLIERSLRIVLLNLAPDRTIAWTLAGGPNDIHESRMYYCAHSSQALAWWCEQAQKVLMSTHIDGLLVTPPEPTTKQQWPDRYAGAVFLPQLNDIKKLCTMTRARANDHPPASAILVSDSEQTRISRGSPKFRWSEQATWQNWNDQIVLWAYIVQLLQTSYRARIAPQDVYDQWLDDPLCLWLSMEDKRTKDRDESRSNVMTPLLATTFTTLTEAQCIYRLKWQEDTSISLKNAEETLSAKVNESNRANSIPFGFMVFDGGSQAMPVTPRWFERQLDNMGFKWPTNFNRATLRYALHSFGGLDGDELDAFLGHGALAERMHDRHSLFDMELYHNRLVASLKKWAELIGLDYLRLHPSLKPSHKEFKRQKILASKGIQFHSAHNHSGKNLSVESKDLVKQDYQRWCHYVSRCLKMEGKWTKARQQGHKLKVDIDALSDEERARTSAHWRETYFAHLKPWHASLYALATVEKMAFAQHVLGLPSSLSKHLDVGSDEDVAKQTADQQSAADALQAKIVSLVAKSELTRSVAAQGMNLSYSICKAIDSQMPTMWVAMTPPARVSPFTRQRIQSVRQISQVRRFFRQATKKAGGTHSDNYVQEIGDSSIKTNDEKGRISLLASSFMSLTAQKDRWVAFISAIHSQNNRHTNVLNGAHLFKSIGIGGRRKLTRLYLHPIFMQMDKMHSQFELNLPNPEKLFRELWPSSLRPKMKLAEWIGGIRALGHLTLPPLIIGHLEGTLNDQAADGPLTKRLGLRQEASTSVLTDIEEDLVHKAVAPTFALSEWTQADVPFGWKDFTILSCTNTNKSVDNPSDTNYQSAIDWLKALMLSHLGGPDSGASNDDLSDVLMEAVDIVPADLCKSVKMIASALRKHNNLDSDEESDTSAAQVDRFVVDFGTYESIMSTMHNRINSHKNSSRQLSIRLLFLLAFRLGMRRSEILFLRRGDVDLLAEGRVFVRAFGTHTLKSSFAKRSLPIVGLLNEKEIGWLKESCDRCDDPSQLLIPQSQHRTLANVAIALLRKISGDNRLKLHHLRHSFSSWLTLKIVCARNPDWCTFFSGFPEIKSEMLCAKKDLIGVVLKPKLQAGDFLVVPRLMGHSSFEVSTAIYVHTLDIVAAMHMVYRTVPDMGSAFLSDLIQRRFRTTVGIISNAMHSGPQTPHPLDHKQTPELPLSVHFEECVINLHAEREKYPSDITPSALLNWSSPHHATGLPQALRAGLDRLNNEDIESLLSLKTRWVSSRSMFLFGQRKVNSKPLSETESFQRNDAGRASAESDAQLLLRLLIKMDLNRDMISFWRWAKADSNLHGQNWDAILSESGFVSNTFHSLPGESSSTAVLGISLGEGRVKKAPNMGTFLSVLDVLWSRRDVTKAVY